MSANELFVQQYPTLGRFSSVLRAPDRDILGRGKEIVQVMAALSRPVLSNVILLAEPGTGKTALVQAVAQEDAEREFREVDLSAMIAGLASPDEMATLVKQLFDEAEQYAVNNGSELVLFIDEFHQVVQLSAAAVEAFKPALAASGTRGLRIIAATTFDEFHQHVQPNQALVERLQRINLSPPDRTTTVAILRDMAATYEVADQFYDDSMFETIHELTERYMPASAQPRKSILVLDSMVGWNRYTGKPLDLHLLAEVLEESSGVNVAFNVDAANIKTQLDEKVLAQDFATAVMAKRLQLCVADLHDKTKPISSFLFTGSTGVGKGTPADVPVPVYTEDGSVAWKPAGKIAVGDFVFDASGAPERVLGVFPQRKQPVYKVSLSDGRSLVTDGPHLWGVYPSLKDRERGLTVMSTETLARRFAESSSYRTRKLRYSIPMNGAVRWPKADLPLDPYALGALIADGCLSPVVKPLTMSSDDEYIVARVSKAVGGVGYDPSKSVPSDGRGTCRANYKWVFRSGRQARRGIARIQKVEIIGMLPEVMDSYSTQRRIPSRYMTASVEQRWELVRGLFDSDGHIGGRDGGRFNVSYSTSSEGLASDVRDLLYSLGVIASVTFADRNKRHASGSREYTVHVRSQQCEKARFFALPRKLEIAVRAAQVKQGKPFDTKFVDIVSVEKLGHEESTVCLYVDHPDHLYQAGDFIVTHNTELTKQLARLLFGDDQRHLVRFDMSEFAEDDSLSLFRSELTQRVWSMGHCVLLLDEVEKAASTVTRLLLQVLDDGRMSDDNGRQVSFLNCYVVLTTNAGSEIFKTIEKYSPSDDGSGKELVKRMREIRRSISTTTGDNAFPPELLGRIDAIVPFQPLSLETRRRITLGKLVALKEEVRRKHGVTLFVGSRVLTYLVDDKADSDSDAGGARAALSLLADEVTTAVAAYINAHPREKNLRVRIDGVLRTEDKSLLESDATVLVTN